MRLSWPPLGKWTRSNDQSGCDLIRPQFEFLEISIGIIQTGKRQPGHCQQVCAAFHSCGQHSAKASRCWTLCSAPADIGAAAPPFLPAKTVWFGQQPRIRKASDCRTVQDGQPGATVPGSFSEIGVHNTAGVPRLAGAQPEQSGLHGSGNIALWRLKPAMAQLWSPHQDPPNGVVLGILYIFCDPGSLTIDFFLPLTLHHLHRVKDTN